MMSAPSSQYATDVTDAQWQQIEPLLPASMWRSNGPGRPPRDQLQIVNGHFALRSRLYLKAIRYAFEELHTLKTV